MIRIKPFLSKNCIVYTRGRIVIQLFLCMLCTSCSGPVYNSLWQKSPVKADGIPNEWSKPLKHYDTNTKIQYTFSNDWQNMYICIRATDDITQKKILRGGMVVWIDTTGKNKERTSITYPLPDLTTKSEPENERSNQDGDSYRPKRKFHNDHNEMQLNGFKPPVGGLVPLQNVDGIYVNLNVDSLDILTYEAVIPFRTFYRDSLQMSDSSRVMSFKIVINGLPSGKKADQGADNSAASSMGSNTMGGGGRPGGGGSRGGKGGGTGPVNPLYESHSVKSQIKLSIKNK